MIQPNPGHESYGAITHVPKKMHRDCPPYFALRLGTYLRKNNIDIDYAAIGETARIRNVTIFIQQLSLI